MPPQTTDLWRLTASEVASGFREGSFTVEVYVRSLLSQIEAREPLVKAWAYLDPAMIISQARQLDQIPLHDRGPLHGIPIGVKDIMYTLGDLELKPALYSLQLTSGGRYADKAQFPNT